MAKQSQQFAWEVSNGTMTVRDRTANNALVFEADATEYPQPVLDFLLDHGLKTKFQQFTSDVAACDKVEAWEKLDALLRQGILEQPGQRGAPTVAAWVQALADYQGTSVAAIQKALQSYSKEARDDMRKNVERKLAAQIEAIEAQKAEVQIDLSDFEG